MAFTSPDAPFLMQKFSDGELKQGIYTIYWEEETKYNNGFYTPGVVNNVRGYSFTGTKIEVALHIKFYLARKDNLVKVEVTPVKRSDFSKKKKKEPKWIGGHKHWVDGKPSIHPTNECPAILEDYIAEEGEVVAKKKKSVKKAPASAILKSNLKGVSNSSKNKK